MADRGTGKRKSSGRGLYWLLVAIVALALAGLGLEHSGSGPTHLAGVLSKANQKAGPQQQNGPPQGNNAGKGPHNNNPPPQADPNHPKMSGGHQHNQKCNPNLKANPHDVSAPGSTTVTITNAFNCGPNGASTDSFTVTFYDNPNTTATVDTGPSGSGSNTLAIPPDANAGNNTITAVDNQGNYAETNVNVKTCKPHLQLKPNHGKSSQMTTVQVTIKNCTSDTFTVTFYGNPNATTSVTTDSSGSGQNSMTIPAGEKVGKHLVVADDGHGHSTTTTFNVQQ